MIRKKRTLEISGIGFFAFLLGFGGAVILEGSMPAKRQQKLSFIEIANENPFLKGRVKALLEDERLNRYEARAALDELRAMAEQKRLVGQLD